MPVDKNKIRALAERIMANGNVDLRRFDLGGGKGSSGGGHSGGRGKATPEDFYRERMRGSDNKWERISNARYFMANDSLRRGGASLEDAERLARILGAQSALETGWVDDVKGNNFAGYMSKGKRMTFDDPSAFWDYHISNLDRKWPGWRDAKDITEYYNIVNHPELGLDTKEKFDAYNRAHRDNPVYIYAPAWENSNYLRDLSSVYDRYINKYVNLDFSDGGDIHIDESHKGLFTAKAMRAGRGVQEHASHVLANKEDYSSRTVKQAAFAKAASKWHSDGGAIGKAFESGDLDLLRAAVNNVMSRKLNKFDEGGEKDKISMAVDSEGNLIDDIVPSVFSLRDITGRRRREIKELAEQDALSGLVMPNLDTSSRWRKRVYDRRFNRTLLQAAELEREKRLKREAVEELRTGVPIGAFKEYTREGIDDMAPFAMGVVGASAAPFLEGAAAASGIPQVKTAIDVAGSVDGIRNAVSGNGVRKTIKHVRDGEYGAAALSAAGDVFDIAGGVGLIGDVGKYVGRTKAYKKAKRLYDMGNWHNTGLYSDDGWRDAATRYATKRSDFTEKQKGMIRDRVLRNEKTRAEERLFGGKYSEVFKKHATTPELKKAFRENPEYLKFIDESGMDPLSQEAIDAFGRRQNRSVRGVYLKEANSESINKAMTEFNPRRANSGGDRLQSGGGVYSSNSYGIADRFRRPGDNTVVDNVISEIQYPYVRTEGSLRQQLGRIRESVMNRDDWYSDANTLLHELPPQRDYGFLESEYTTRNGDVIGGAFERATTKPIDVDGLVSDIQHGLPNAAGRWGIGGVPADARDVKLFIPKVTTRGDLEKMIRNGKTTVYSDLSDDFLSNIQRQQRRRRELVEGSLPYKIGNHVYDNTVIIGDREVYSPLFITGLVGGGAGLLSGTIYGGSQLGKESDERSTRRLRDFKKSDIYKKYLESERGPEAFLRYLEEYKKSGKKKD